MAGFDPSAANAQYAPAWQGFDFNNFQGGLSQGLLDAVGQAGGSLISPDGKYQINKWQEDIGGRYEGDQWISDKVDRYGIYHVGGGKGNIIPYFNEKGGFLKAGMSEGDGGLQNFTTALLAALSMGAYGAVAGAAGAAGEGAAAAGAGAGAGAGASTVPASFGIVDTTAGAQSLAGGFSAVDAAMPAFGVVDQAAAEAIMAGLGSPVASGAPLATFGVVDEAAADAIRAGLGTPGGAGFTGGMTGEQADAFFGDSPLQGGGATVQGPGELRRMMALMQSGGFSPEALMQFARGGGGTGGLLKSLGVPSSVAEAVGLGQPLMQILSGIQGRRKAKGLRGQMQSAVPEIDAVREGMRLPDPSDVTKLPGYQAGLEAVRRSMASQGYQGSGNMMAALSKYGGDFYNQAVNQRIASGNAQLQALLAKLGATESQAGPTAGEMSSMALINNGIWPILSRFAS